MTNSLIGKPFDDAIGSPYRRAPFHFVRLVFTDLTADPPVPIIMGDVPDRAALQRAGAMLKGKHGRVHGYNHDGILVVNFSTEPQDRTPALYAPVISITKLVQMVAPYRKKRK